MVKLCFPLEIAYLIDSSQINFMTSVKNFSNNKTGCSTVSSTRSSRVHLKPVGSQISEWIHLFTCCELFLSLICFLNRHFCRSIFTLLNNHLSNPTFYFQYSRTKKLITSKITCICCCCVFITRINITAWSVGIEWRLEINFCRLKSTKDSSSESELTSRLSK